MWLSPSVSTEKQPQKFGLRQSQRQQRALSYQKTIILVGSIRAYQLQTTLLLSPQAQCINRGDTLEQPGFPTQQQQPQSVSFPVHGVPSQPMAPHGDRSSGHTQCHSGDPKP